MTRRNSCGKAGTHAGITEHSIAREPMCGECAEFHATNLWVTKALELHAPRVVEVPLGGLIADLVAAGWGKS